MDGKATQVITATKERNKFLVANVADYDRGLATLVVSFDEKGAPLEGVMSSIDMFQPSQSVHVDRLNIQRAQSAVLVEKRWQAICDCLDDNYSFNDPYYRAMYEAPMFIYTPSGPPIAIGGSISAKKVAVGGKLGIIEDPFATQNSSARRCRWMATALSISVCRAIARS